MAGTGKHLILLGPPGVGKGAQAALLSARLGVPHLSTGELFRREIARGSEVGRRIQRAVERGEFVDDATVVHIVMEQLGRPEYGEGFVLDGFPRTLEQAQRFDAHLARHGLEVDRTLLFEAPEETILERLRGRLVCSSCGQTYHQSFDPPHQEGVCDTCGGEVAARADDAVEKHLKRLRAYRERTEPLVRYYRERGKLVEVGAGGAVEEVAARVQAALEAAG